MLDFMRSRVQSVWTKGLFLVIALVFVFFGIGSFGDDAQVRIVATVDDEPITVREFQRAYRNVEASYREQYKDRFTPELAKQMNLRQQTLDQLITAKLFTKEAHRLGFRVSDEEVRREIAANPAFEGFGSFSPDRYRRLLRALRLTPQEFEEQQRDGLVLQRFQRFVESSVRATDFEVDKLYEFEQERVNLDFVKIASEDLVDSVTVEEQALTDFYENHKETFRTPERVRFGYVTYDPVDFAPEVSVSEADVQEYYDTYKDDLFTDEQQVRARHILFSVSENDSDEAKAETRTTALGVLERARDGEDFASLAEEFSQDEGTAEQGGDLGFFGRGRMVEPFEEAAFSLDVGQISDLVETTFGFHVIKVDEIRSAEVRPLEDVADQVTETLLERESRRLAEERARADRQTVGDGVRLAEFAESAALTVQETPLVATGETIPGLGEQPTLVQAALAQEPGQISQPIQVDDVWFLVSLEERAPSRIPEFSGVQSDVERRYRSEQAETLAKQRADALFTKLQETRDLASLARAEDLEVEETGPFTRAGGYVPKIGNLPALKAAAFRLNAENPVPSQTYVWGGNAYVVAFKEHLPADAEQLEQRREELRESLVQQKRAEALREFEKYLKKQAQIEYNQANLLGTS